MDRKNFTFEVTYFKPSGKLYISEEFECEVAVIHNGSPYMIEVVEILKEKRTLKTLPGLQSGNWEGYILVNHPEGYPCLIIRE